MLVSENNTSYGKDLGDIRLLETLLPELADVDGIERIRVSYLQPAEMRPGLIDVLTSTPKVAPYFDLSFQHSAPGCCARCAASGTPTASWSSWRPSAAARRRPVRGRTSSWASRGDRGRPRRAGTLPHRCAARCHRRLRVLRRGGHRGGRLREQARRRRHRGAARAHLAAGRGADVPARRGAARRVPPGAGRVGRPHGRRAARGGPCGASGPETDGQVLFTGREGLVPGRMVEAKVVGTEGVDLVAECSELAEAAR